MANVFTEGSRYSGTNLFVFRQCCDTEGRIVLKSHTKGQSDMQIFEQWFLVFSLCQNWDKCNICIRKHVYFSPSLLRMKDLSVRNRTLFKHRPPEVGIQFAGIFPHSACRRIPIFADELCTLRFNTCVRANNVKIYFEPVFEFSPKGAGFEYCNLKFRRFLFSW